eukprot:TRINITY_DN1831_c0_g1_i1.p2 TRINITY_DN1831_c0_g1~~TRINITY_DN1831_c0_g1_i1.p2  ORF type:complete len:157 (+),score=72.73 TRINITY_DN1831_c0_g1_i1:101-571(+)
MSSSSAILRVVFGVAIFFAALSCAGPAAGHFRCFNFCNVTYEFGSTCQNVEQDLIYSASNQTDFTLSTKSSSFLHVVHKTTSQCCPPGQLYYEDVYFEFDAQHDGGCTVRVSSKSQSGSCDFGQDIANILVLVDYAAIYNRNLVVDVGPIIEAGCF